MAAIGLGMAPPALAMGRPPFPLRVPAGLIALRDREGRLLLDRDGAVLLGRA